MTTYESDPVIIDKATLRDAFAWIMEAAGRADDEFDAYRGRDIAREIEKHLGNQ